MSTHSQESVATVPAPPIVQRVSAFAKRAVDAIDVPSLQLALKSCLAISLATGIAFSLNISVTITAVTAFMIQQSYVGSTIYRGTLRFIGGSMGAVFALVVLALFGQDRVLFIGTISLGAGIIVYFLQGTRYWYAYILCLASLVVVGYGSIEHPQTAFSFAVTWASAILLAVVVVSVVRGLLWPTLTARVFEDQLRGNLENCRDLLRTTGDTLLDGQDRRAAMQRTEQTILQGLQKPQTTLQTAMFDSWQVDRFEASYNCFLNRVTRLAQLFFELSEIVRICETNPALFDFTRESTTLPRITQHLNDQIQKLIESLSQPRDGSIRLHDVGQNSSAVDSLFTRLATEIRETESDLFEKGALLGMRETLAQLGTQLSELRTTLTQLETAAAESAAHGDATSRQTAPPFWPRFTKSVQASLVMIVVPCIWILTNWPMALNRLMIYAAVIACFNALFPAIPRRAILNGLAWGVFGGAILYFALLRPLDGFPELALALSFAMLPCCYFINSPKPGTMLTGLFAGMIIIGLMDLSLIQSYSFSTFANNAIGYSGGFMIAMIIFQTFAGSTPEQAFCRNVSSFFQSSRETLDALSADPPWTDRGKAVLAAQQARALKTYSMCGLWSRMVNPRRAPQNDSEKVRVLLASMKSLLFRIEMTEQARLPVPDETAFAPLVAAVCDLRTSFENSLQAIQITISGDRPTGELPDTNAKIEELRRQLDSLHDDPAVDTTDRRTAGRFLVLVGYYHSLADAIDLCGEHVNALNWPEWESSYI